MQCIQYAAMESGLLIKRPYFIRLMMYCISLVPTLVLANVRTQGANGATAAIHRPGPRQRMGCAIEAGWRVWPEDRAPARFLRLPSDVPANSANDEAVQEPGTVICVRPFRR